MTRDGISSKILKFFPKPGRQTPLVAADDPVLLELQQILLEGTSLARNQVSPQVNLQDLSIEELEALLARKKAEQTRFNPTRPFSNSYPFSPDSSSLSARFRPDSPLYQAGPVGAANHFTNSAIEDAPSRRFAPASLVATAPVVQPKAVAVKKNGPFQLVRNFAGYVLEVLVIVAALGLAGNWLFQQFGINLNFFAPPQVSELLVAPSRSEGLFLSAQAAGTIALPPTATAAPTPTVAPMVTPMVAPTATAAPLPTATVAPDLSPVALMPSVSPDATSTIEATPSPEATATPTEAVTAAVAVAPTPTPAIVQPVKQSLAQGAATPKTPPGPPTRLVIPKIGVDTAVEEVTINLGTWQVADFVAGHNQGTAMPGQNGNMVLVGHRDIRGSIFLRLNELQKGDEFQVFTATSSYRYIITEVRVVEPTEVSVLNPTLDPTATLITCTPIGLATHRLVLKAVLEK